MTSFFAIRRKVDAKGRVVLPKSVRGALRLDDGNSATIVFVKDKRRVYIRKVEGNDVWQQQQTKAEDLEKK